jgi:hypothetical protein
MAIAHLGRVSLQVERRGCRRAFLEEPSVQTVVPGLPTNVRPSGP